MPTTRLFACLTGVAALLHTGPVATSGERDPSDPDAAVPRAHYHSVMRGYHHTPIPSEPGNWRELNERMEQIGGPAGQLRDPDEPIRRKQNN